MNKSIFFSTLWMMACQVSEPPNLDESESSSQTISYRLATDADFELEDSIVESADIIPVQARDRRRMNIFQLNQALLDLTGYEYSVLLEVNGPLGQPDYREVINEVREPELFFQKFLQDAAHTNCDMLLDDEETRSLSERKFLKYIEPGETTTAEVEDNLSFLLLRYHGHRYETASAEVQTWSSLFSSVQQNTADAQTTWKAICVALIRHPDFYSY